MAGLVVAAIMVLLSGCASVPRYDRAGAHPADCVIYDARVFTSNAKQPWAEAVAVKDGRLIYVGDNAGAGDFVGSGTRLICARGRMLAPGFVDNHCHVLWIGALMSLMTKELYDCASMDDLKAALLKQSRENPDLPFVSGVGWRKDYVPGGAPDPALLDSIIPDRPVYLMAFDAQDGWVNSKGLALMQERNPAAMERMRPIRDKKTGACTGFRHFHTFSPLDFYTAEQLGAPAKARMMKAMEATLQEALSVGVTTMHDVQIYRDFVPYILEFRDRGGLERARVRCAFR